MKFFKNNRWIVVVIVIIIIYYLFIKSSKTGSSEKIINQIITPSGNKKNITNKEIRETKIQEYINKIKSDYWIFSNMKHKAKIANAGIEDIIRTEAILWMEAENRGDHYYLSTLDYSSIP